MARVAASYDVPIVVMHNQDGTEYGDIIEDMKSFLLNLAVLPMQLA